VQTEHTNGLEAKGSPMTGPFAKDWGILVTRMFACMNNFIFHLEFMIQIS
jgi:hypothetical protein